MRGRIAERSGSGAALRVLVMHEAIPEFRDRDGKITGMDAMSMAFGVAPTVEVSALQPGTQWRLTFTVRWNEEPALLITSTLPLAGEALQLGSTHAH